MKRIFIITVLLAFLTTFYSCNNSYKLIYKYKNERVKISLIESNKPDPRVNRYEFYAKVDSSTTHFYYIFYPGNVYKLYENNQTIIYSLTYANKPAVSLTGLDKFVLNLAGIYIDSLGRKKLQFKKGATGFLEEINNTPYRQ